MRDTEHLLPEPDRCLIVKIEGGRETHIECGRRRGHGGEHVWILPTVPEAHQSREDALMACDHPTSSISSADEGTSYCTACAQESNHATEAVDSENPIPGPSMDGHAAGPRTKTAGSEDDLSSLPCNCLSPTLSPCPAHRDEINHAIGVIDERARIVAWLEDGGFNIQTAGSSDYQCGYEVARDRIAEHIERGDHEGEL